MAVDAARQAAYAILLRFEKAPKSQNARYKADSLIQQQMAEKNEDAWSAQDRAFLTALVYGVLRQWTLLNHQLQTLSGRELKKIPAESRILIKLGFFQLQFLSQVPDYAAINTTVELAKKRKLNPASVKFINALLRACQRKLAEGGFEIPDPQSDPAAHISLTYSLPMWWVKRLLAQYPQDDVLAMARACGNPAPLSVRVNTLKTSIEAFQNALQKAGIAFEQPETDLPEILTLSEFSGSPRAIPGYEEGWFYVQDPSSAWVGRELAPQAGDAVLDLCAAPGSKTTHMAALMGNAGKILAVEPKAERVKILEENLARLGVENVTVLTMDGLKLQKKSPLIPENFADGFTKILVDAPCSGLGTIRRHPEIPVQLRVDDLRSYREKQKALLEKGWQLLSPGGYLVYSTCSVDPDENEKLVEQFVAARNKAATLERSTQRLITESADGFFVAVLRKNAGL